MRLLFVLAGVLCAAIVRGADGEPADKPSSDLERAVAEFKLETAQMGLRADSSQSKRQHRAPAQPWHGRVFENFRNDFLDAVPHEIVQRGGDKSLLRRNQFGFNLTGPVEIPWLLQPRPGTYFSFSYEGVRERISRTSLRTIPTAAERTGDFSSTVDQSGNPLPVYDPAATAANPAYDPNQPVSRDNLQYLRQPFPSNRVPLTRLDPVALRALTFYPAPNANAGPFFQNNLFINSPETNTANGIIVKVDHAVSDRHRLGTEVNYSNGLLNASRWFDTIANPGPADTKASTRRAAMDYTFTPSAQTVNTLSVDATSRRWDSGSPADAFPVYRFAEYLGMARSSPFTANAHNTYVFSDGLSIRQGKHSLHLAVSASREQVNSLWPRDPDGFFEFSAGLTSLPGIVNTGHSFASFLLGHADYADRNIVAAPSYFRRNGINLSVRDQYEIRKDLTITVSATLLCDTPRFEKFNRQSTIDLEAINPAGGLSGALVEAGADGVPRGLRPNVMRVDPAVSIAWSPGAQAKMVVRASFRRVHPPLPIYFGQFGTQGFNGYQSWISPNVQLAPAVLLQDGLAGLANPLPDLRPDAANNTIADLIDTTGRDPMYQTAGLSVERELPGSLVATLGFTYSGGRDLPVGSGSANPNAISPDALSYRDLLNDEAFNQSLRPYPQYKGFQLYSSYPYGRYQRDAGYLRLEKRVSKGLSLSAYFERSKQLDDYSGPYGTQDYFHRANEWSLTPSNRPQQLQFSYVYELPVGTNKFLFNYSDWRRFVVSGWSISGSGTYYSGRPLALTPEFNNTGGVITALHVNAVPGVDPNVSDPGPDLWYNPAAFDQPADFTMGNLSRTHPSLRGPSTQNYDLSFTKRLPIDSDRVVEFSAAAFNVTNHAVWNDPDVTIGPAEAPNVNAGKIIGSEGGRVVQLGLRFSF